MTTMVSTSKSSFSNTEHLHLGLGADGEYAIRVKWTGFLYNRVGDPSNIDYGLAWYGTAIPVPGSFVLLMSGLVGFGSSRRRR